MKYALLIIDMQNAYFRNGALAERNEALLKNCNTLIDAAFSNNTPVYNVVTEHKRDRSTWTLNMLDDNKGYLFEGDEETNNLPGLLIDYATKVRKTRDSAFFGTYLDSLLREQGVEWLVLAGVSTHSCIYETAADAYAHNLRVMLVQGAIASHDMQYHDSALAALEQEYRQRSVAMDEAVSILKET